MKTTPLPDDDDCWDDNPAARLDPDDVQQVVDQEQAERDSRVQRERRAQQMLRDAHDVDEIY
jgi:hypothetical protein